MAVKEPESLAIELAVLASTVIGLGIYVTKVVQQGKRVQVAHAARKLSK